MRSSKESTWHGQQEGGTCIGEGHTEPKDQDSREFKKLRTNPPEEEGTGEREGTSS